MFARDGRPTPLGRAFAEYGRIDKTMHLLSILDPIDDGGMGGGSAISGRAALTTSADGFEVLYPKYKGGRPRTFALPDRREIKKIAKSKPAEHGLPSSTWSLVKLADFLVAEGVVDDISHEGLRVLLREEGVSMIRRCIIWRNKNAADEHLRKNVA
ncbi:hypothetical protein [Actinoallomurus sp. NPDC050550]|uniref:hypothetical protein n=1 Tax=Actinoallomurus sp. NPDC050550 TaxID=3154937 RepID=UPI0033E1F9CF